MNLGKVNNAQTIVTEPEVGCLVDNEHSTFTNKHSIMQVSGVLSHFVDINLTWRMLDLRTPLNEGGNMIFFPPF